MIKLLIKTSEDPFSIGEYKFGINNILIGSSNSADIIINSNLISPLHLELNIESNNLFTKNISQDVSYFINDKKIEGKKRIEVGDSIKISGTTFEILEFNESKKKTIENYDELYEKLVSKNPEMETVIESIENAMRRASE